MPPLRCLLVILVLSVSSVNLANAAEPAITLKQALDVVKTESTDKALSSELSNKEGVPAYRIKVLTKAGVVKILFVDASSGETLK